MSEESGNRVVVTEDDQVKRIKSDKEIVEENAKLEAELKGKAKNPVKERNDMTVMLVEEQDRSVNVGVVGVGQCGSKLAEEFYKRGYTSVAINTATQDLKPIQIPERQKLFLDYALGGAAKDLETGQAAAEEYSDQILEFIESNFEDNEVLMLVISGGGGCTTGHSMIFTSNGGVEKISDFYNRMCDKYGCQEGPDEQLFIDIRDENVYSFSLNSNGDIIRNKINEVWFNGIKNEYIRVKSNLGIYEVTPYHPFFVFDGKNIVERKANELKMSDRLIGPGNCVYKKWPFVEPAVYNNKQIDEATGWFLGALCGDGHLHKNGRRFDITSEQEVINKFADIVSNKYNIHRGDYYKELNNNVSSYYWYNKEICDEIKGMLELDSFGSKSDKIAMPSLIKKSPLNVIGAFMAGLIDTDGFVWDNKLQIKYSTVSEKMANDICSVLNLLNCNATIRTEKPHGKGTRVLYNVYVCGKENFGFITDYVLPNMIQKNKINNITKNIEKEQKSFHKSKVFITKQEFLNEMPDANFTFGDKRFWHNQEYLTTKSFAGFIKNNNYSGILEKIYDKLEKIESISYEDDEIEFYDLSMSSLAEHNYLAGNGGFTFIHNTGSGSAETMVNLMAQLDKPLSVIYVLPMSSEDTLAKHNSIQTLSKLAKLASQDVVNSLIVVDNAKIELLYSGLSMAEFWKTANNAIVEPLHLFNQLSSTPSEYTSLDPMDFTRVFVGTGDCSLYGMIEVDDYMAEEAIAEAIITNMENGLLASEFNLEQTRSAGVIITGSREVLQQVPATNLEYGFAMVNKICSEGTQVFRGVYEVPEQDNLRVYSLFSGLGLPEERIGELKAEAERHMASLQSKEHNRASNMHVDIGKTKAVSATDALHKKITTKKSAMGKIKRNSKRVVDRRRK